MNSDQPELEEDSGYVIAPPEHDTTEQFLAKVQADVVGQDYDWEPLNRLLSERLEAIAKGYHGTLSELEERLSNEFLNDDALPQPARERIKAATAYPWDRIAKYGSHRWAQQQLAIVRSVPARASQMTRRERRAYGIALPKKMLEMLEAFGM